MQQQRQSYTAITKFPESDLDRQKKLIELGEPDFLEGEGVSYSNWNCRVTSTTPVKLKSGAVQVPEQTDGTRILQVKKL